MPNYGAKNLEALLGAIDMGYKSQQERSAQREKSASDLENLLKGKQAEHDLSEEGAQKRLTKAEEMFKKYPNAAVSVSKEGASLSPREGNGRSTQQKRLEATTLNRIYADQTKPIKEMQGTLEQINPLLADPTNIDDQQLRRTLALAVNKGALSDKDVEDALPGDIEQSAKKAFNFVQPALNGVASAFGSKVDKKPIYSEGTVRGIQKLVEGKMRPLDAQLSQAEQQILSMAPTIAPTLSAEAPETLQQLISGIKGPRASQQQRIVEGFQKTTGGAAPQPPQDGPIRVRRKADGKTGSMPRSKFDPALYDEVK